MIVAIGGCGIASIMTTALLKQLKVKGSSAGSSVRCMRPSSPAIGIDEVVHPGTGDPRTMEQKLDMKGVVESFNITGQYNIIETKTPLKYVDKTIGECEIRES